MLGIRVLGFAAIAPDVSTDLAHTTIASLHVLGALQASDVDKAALPDRIICSNHTRKHEMNLFLTRGMAKAVELTRFCKLQEATALIQSQPRHSGPDRNFPAAEPDLEGSVIDGDFTKLESEATPPKAPVPKAKPERAKPRTTIKPLAETLRKIAAGGKPMRGPLSGQAVPVPEGAGHTDPKGPDASRQMVQFLLQHTKD